MVSLRTRNRLNAMRTTQRTALPMFQERGFDQVTVSEVAVAAGLAASTIYRHFETKEAIVIWDEHDPEIDDELVARLKRQPPLEAIRDTFIATLAGRYEADLEFQLGRIQYIYATEALHAAAVEYDLSTRDELTSGLRHFLSRANKSAAPIIAGAALLALDVAMDNWQSENAKHTLDHHLSRAFDQLTRIDSIV